MNELTTRPLATADLTAASRQLSASYLLPQTVGRGMGRLLYAEAEKAMAAQGYQRCILETLSQNHRAIRFYLAHGYAKTKTHWVKENGMTLSCDWMEKQLL